MRGSVRHRGTERGGTWEYIVDVGLAAAQRCQGCNKRFWVERRPKGACPTLRGQPGRDRGAPSSDAGRVQDAEECVAAMNKLLVSVEEQNFVATTKLSVKEFLAKEWLPAVEATIRPTTFRSYQQHVNRPHRAAHRQCQATEAQRAPR